MGRLIKRNPDQALRLIKRDPDQALRLIKRYPDQALRLIKRYPTQTLRLIKKTPDHALRLIKRNSDQALRLIKRDQDQALEQETDVEENAVEMEKRELRLSKRYEQALRLSKRDNIDKEPLDSKYMILLQDPEGEEITEMDSTESDKRSGRVKRGVSAELTVKDIYKLLGSKRDYWVNRATRVTR